MLKCNEVSHLVASGEDQNLGLFKKMQLHLHLMMCQHCRRYRAQLQALGSLARRVWGPQTTDAAVLDRLEQRILNAMRGGAAGPGTDL